MKHFSFPTPSILFAVVFLAGCVSSGRNDRSGTADTAFAPPTGLAGVYAASSVTLKWKNHATASGGNLVEFNFDPREEFTILAFVAGNVTTFRHEDVAGETRFNYRLHSYYGQPSGVAEITTGDIPQSDAPNMELEGPLPETNAVKTAVESIRSPATFAAAAPDHLAASQASPTSIDLRWQDHASDEDGYLLEIATGRPEDFAICALLPADTTSFKKIYLQPHTRCYFRVRAFFYGTPTPTVTVVTPKEEMKVTAQ